MAKFIKIRKEDLFVTGPASVFPVADSDVLIGKAEYVKQGTFNSNDTDMPNNFTLFIKNGKYFTFKVTGQAVAWTKAIQSALMQTSEGSVVTVLPIFDKGTTPAKVTEIQFN